jgi:hypothetical protein
VISDSEKAELFFGAFLDALETLSLDADEQCTALGDYNVAWELRQEVSAGLHLRELSCVSWTVEQSEGLKRLVGELEQLPPSVVGQATTREENLVAMNHPCWVPIRQHARALLNLFKMQ